MARFSTVWGWVDGGAEVWPGLGLTEKIKKLVPWWTPRECNRTDLRVCMCEMREKDGVWESVCVCCV